MQLGQDMGRAVPCPVDGGGGRLRRCIVSKDSLPADLLVRFVVGPDGVVVPDIAGKLPGRGLWLRAERDIVARACTGKLFDRAARASVRVPDDLAQRVEDLLARRCLELIGLARRAGEAVAGYEKTRAMLSGGGAGVLLAACDGADDGRAKLRALRPDVPRVEVLIRDELGSVFGRETVVHGAVEKGRLANGLIREAKRLAGFVPRQAPGKLN